MATVRTDLETRALYSQAAGIQRIVPVAVARPTTPAELDTALEWARERGLGVTARGAGSAMDGSSIGPGMILDCSALDMRLAIDSANRTARVGAGVTLGRIQHAAALSGLRFGPDPSSQAWATVGGVIGTNAAGARSFGLGAVDAWVESLRLLTDDGSIAFRRGEAPDPTHPVIRRWTNDADPILARHRDAVLARWPRSRKNTAGYALQRFWNSGDLLDLVIGAEGTLGVVVDATLRLELRPAARASLQVRLATREALPATIARLAACRPTTLELLDGTFLRFVGPDAVGPTLAGAGAVLLVDFEGDELAGVTDAAERAARAAKLPGVTSVVATSPDAIERLWAVRHRASPLLAALGDGRVSMQVIEDGCVPPACLAEYLAAIERVAEREGVDVVMFGHAGDGHVHVNLLPDLGRADWLHAVRTIHDEVFEIVVRLEGTPAGEHGAGRLRAGVLPRLLGPEAMACFRAVKAAFDPNGRFNPGVILADGVDPFGQLKYGSGAEPLPGGTAATLAGIETGRRYGESRWPS